MLRPANRAAEIAMPAATCLRLFPCALRASRGPLRFCCGCGLAGVASWIGRRSLLTCAGRRGMPNSFGPALSHCASDALGCTAFRELTPRTLPTALYGTAFRPHARRSLPLAAQPCESAQNTVTIETSLMNVQEVTGKDIEFL